jgi:hypothetical protein
VAQTTYADTGLTALTRYWYRVRATNGSVVSSASNVADATTLAMFRTILDNFNRANEGPPPSANWTNDGNGLKVLSNECAPNADAFNAGYWNAATFGPDCEGFVTITTLPTGNGYVLVEVKYNPATFVGCAVDYTAGGLLIVYAFDSSTLYSAAQTMNAGDAIGIRCVGTTVSAYRKPAAGSWTLIGSWTDSSPGMAAATGRIELAINKNVARCDDFGGGTI